MLKKIMFLVFSILLFGTLVSCQERPSKYVPMNLIPKPKELDGKKNGDGEYKALEYGASIKTENDEWKNAVSSFCEYSKKIHDIEFTEESKAEIVLKTKSDLKAGAYKIVVGNNVNIYASDSDGINNALATMIQIMVKSGDKVYIPEVEIYDYSDSIYRGMLVDLARDWHEFEYLLNYVDMCYFYKVEVLHLHFTDTQSYTLPSDAYPDLSTPNRHYTKEQINTLVEYANSRGVELMPEIDVPGHCESFQKAYPKLFGTNGIIHQHEDSMEAMDAIFSELCELFKYSKYIHIGGDEAAISKWTECKKCRDYAETKGINTKITDRRLLSEQMLAHFVQRLSDAVFRNNKQPIVWEGFAKDVNDMVSKDIIVMSWENYYQLTPDLLEAGFKIINCSWAPMYVVTPVAMWPVKEVFEWNIFSWRPVHGGSPYIKTGLVIEPNDNVLGGQLLAWGDQIEKSFPNVEDGVKEEMRLLLERLPAMAENTWNREKARTFEDFTKDADVLNNKLKSILKIKA